MTSSAGSQAHVEIANVTHWFAEEDGDRLTVLDSIDLRVESGEVVAVVGPSGCGKTTLLNLIGGLDAVLSGSLLINGLPPLAGSRDVGHMFARDALLPWRSALGNVELALEMRGVGKRERREVASRALADVGLSHFESSLPSQLSQGMRQRVALARTIAAHPSLLLMDEPFAALDAQTKIVVQERFVRLWSRLGMTAVLITHDLAEAIALADRVVVMTRRPGRIRSEVAIALPRPRSILSLQGDHQFHKIYESLWQELRDEVQVD